MYSSNMASRHEDITGQKFGRVTALYFLEQSTSRGAMWHCRCDCGREFDTYATHLKRGATKSCGCLRDEKIANLNRGKITLTWEDVRRLDIMIQGKRKGVTGVFSGKVLSEGEYQDILNRFNEQRYAKGK